MFVSPPLPRAAPVTAGQLVKRAFAAVIQVAAVHANVGGLGGGGTRCNGLHRCSRRAQWQGWASLQRQQRLKLLLSQEEVRHKLTGAQSAGGRTQEEADGSGGDDNT